MTETNQNGVLTIFFSIFNSTEHEMYHHALAGIKTVISIINTMSRGSGVVEISYLVGPPDKTFWVRA